MRVLKKLSSLMLLTAGTVLWSASDARAAYTALANTCVPVLPADASRIAYTAAGVKTTTTTAASVMCYAGIANAGTTTDISVFLVDNNPSFVATCRASAVNSQGGVLWTQTKSVSASMSFTVPNLTGGGQKMLSVECAIPGVSSGNASSIIAIFSS